MYWIWIARKLSEENTHFIRSENFGILNEKLFYNVILLCDNAIN